MMTPVVKVRFGIGIGRWHHAAGKVTVGLQL